MLSLFSRKYWLFAFFLFGTLCLPAFITNSLRVKALSFFSFIIPKPSLISDPDPKLACENALLKNEVTQLRSYLLHHKISIEELAAVGNEPSLSSSQQKKLMARITRALPARVFYRDPYTWGSSLWVALGKQDLEPTCQPLLEKGSPVVFGKALVGVVDYVGKHQSRIRLITDAGVKPSVRVFRQVDPIEINRYDIESVAELLDDPELKKRLLESYREKTAHRGEGWYLAKGFLEGGSAPLWRSKCHYLKGIGFNCDREDLLGPARDLHTGCEIGEHPNALQLPIIEKGDLLITTGMDGVFPPGLEVARVHSVLPLTRAAVAFEIVAVPLLKNLDSIQTVFIIPPYTYQPEDGPQ